MALAKAWKSQGMLFFYFVVTLINAVSYLRQLLVLLLLALLFCLFFSLVL